MAVPAGFLVEPLSVESVWKSSTFLLLVTGSPALLAGWTAMSQLLSHHGGRRRRSCCRWVRPRGDRTLANAALPRHHQNVTREDRQRERQVRVRFIARASTQAVSVNYNFSVSVNYNFSMSVNYNFSMSVNYNFSMSVNYNFSMSVE